MWRKQTLLWPFPALVVFFGALTASSGSMSLSQADEGLFEMQYEELSPKQKALIDEWIERYNQTSDRVVEPSVYNEFPLSVKTTFAAVTNALSSTHLTSQDSEPLLGDQGGPLTALDLIAKLDTIKGKIKGASGDEQFRIYIRLIPGAVDLLEESKEFSRGHDNTVFHKGYPQNFRSGGGVPSIQFSIALTGDVADIDVDYRSSKFPAALINGHLTSGNSDVRAGNNYERHVSNWEGLQEWWSGWEGFGDWFGALFGVRGLDIPETPEAADAPLEEAVHDFLSSWLVQERPDLAMAYFSDSVYRCFRGDRDDDPDASPEQRMYRRMSETVRVIGNPRNLSEVVQGVFLASLGMPAIQGNPYHAQFVLYQVPAERALEFECGFRNMSAVKARAQFPRTGEYALATFFLWSGDLRGATAAMLWSRHSDGWKMVSFELDPADDLVPDLHAPPAVPQARGADDMEVDPALVESSDAFMTAWFVENDLENALAYVSSASYQCLDRFSEPGEENSGDPRGRFRDALEAVSDFVGDIERDTVANAIGGVEPWSPSFRDVTPSDSSSTLIAIPDDAVDAYRCVEGMAGDESAGRRSEPSYGNFYGNAFRLKLAGGEQPGTFFVLWGREDNAWKVIAFDVMAD